MNGEKLVNNSPCTTPRKLKFEQLRADYELFLQTFEKPTWVYRLLHRRQQISPFMLKRNLSYLPKHQQKEKLETKHKKQSNRKTFKLDSLLTKLRKDEEEEEDECDDRKLCLNLTFGGFFHGPGFAEEIFQTTDPKTQEIFKDDFVNVNIDLIQVLFKRKKGTDDPLKVVPLGKCKAAWNPRTQLLLPGSTVQLSVPPELFSENKSYKTQILSVTVSLKVPRRRKKKLGRKKNDLNDSEEPPAKRLKQNINTDSQTEETDTVDEPIFEKEPSTFTAELIVFDRHKTCLLTDGDYELLLHENSETTDENRKNNTFESKFRNKLGPFAAFSFGPTIKFSLCWTSTPRANMSPLYKPLSAQYVDKNQPLSNTCTEADSKNNSAMKTKGTPLPKVYYQFIYSNSTRQQTEAREGTSCPWCNVQGGSMYGLLRHLKSCHSRFSFLYTSLKRGHRIDVCVNDTFEGTLGFDGTKDIGFIDIDHAPIKRKPTTEIIVARPYVDKEELREFMEPDKGDYDGVVPIAGHQRTYFHSGNNQQKVNHLDEFEVNSEDEGHPDWLQEKTRDMIEEFTDVNQGEKVLMKLWNMHVLERGYVADFTVAAGCLAFVENYGRTILKEGLVSNFLIHLNNLLEFQVIGQGHIVIAMDALTKLKMEISEE